MDYQKEYIIKNPCLHLEQSEIKASQILKFLGKIRIDSFLDVACGAGGITKIIKNNLKPNKVIGIDVSREMIKIAKLNDKANEVKWICIDIYQYHPKKKFDLVTGIDIVEHMGDDLKFLKQLAILGNKVLIKVPLEDSILDNKIIRELGIRDPWKESEEKYGHRHHYNEPQIVELLHKAGFKIIKSGYIPLPKRSKFFYEVLRIIFLPIGWFSKKAMVNFVGGFKVVLLEPVSN